MHRAQKQKKQKLDKQRSTSDQTGESGQDASASLPTTTPSTPSSMPSPSPANPLQQQNRSKMAIPRLRRESDSYTGSASASSEHNRISHACESCRNRKTKCSGERPKCQHCLDFKLPCVYIDGKRDRARKEFDNMAEKLETYEKLLKEIGPQTGGNTKQRIANALRGDSSQASQEPSGTQFSPEQRKSKRSRLMEKPSGRSGEERYTARASSLEALDKIDEDFDRDDKVRATGFYGENSEIVWMHQLRQSTEREQRQQDLQDGELQDGELQDGELQDGELQDGELQDGELQDGELQDGKLQDGELQDGELPDGELPDGELPDGGLPDGELPDGELPDGRLQDGELPDGGLQDGELQDGELQDGELQDGELQDGELQDGELRDGELRDGELPDGEPTMSATARSRSKRPAYQPRPGGLKSISSSTYHCDDLPLSIADMNVDKYTMPPRVIADLLLQSYFDTVHPSFPVVCKINFVAEYQDFFVNPGAPSDTWLAILNVMFAIGAKYAHLVEAEWAGPGGDHLVYFTRARLLGFNADSILGHASIQHVQLCGLLAFFLMSIHQINRSWALSGIAIRHAATLGLNLRNVSAEIDNFEKEMRCRTWWALCFLERQLAVMTGRVQSLSDADCTCPRPFPIDEASIINSHAFNYTSGERFSSNDAAAISSSILSYSIAALVDGESQLPQQVNPVETYSPSFGLYFLHLTVLSSFTNEVLTRLYRVSSVNKSWVDTQLTIAELTQRLETWRQELPLAFDFTKRVRDQQWSRQRKALGFLYHSTMLIINRPCLCRTERKMPGVSGATKRFNHMTAAKCVHAAIDMLNLLPDQPDPVGIFAQSPWWSLVHHLVEAAVVCMLELSFRANHMPLEVDEVFESADKAVQWLWSMSSNNVAANRAWTMCDDLLRKVAPKVGKTVNDMPFQLHQLPDLMQGLQQPSYAQAPALAPGGHTYQDSALFQPYVFTTYDQMMAQDPFFQNLLQTSISGPYPNVYTMASNVVPPVSYGNQPADRFYLDPDLEEQQQQRWYQGEGGGPTG